MINRPKTKHLFLGLESGNRSTVFLSTFFRLKSSRDSPTNRAIGEFWGPLTQTAPLQGRRRERGGQSFGPGAESNRCFSPLAGGAENAWKRKTRGTMGPPVEIGHDVAVIDLVLHMYSRAPTRRRLAELWCATSPVSPPISFLTQPPHVVKKIGFFKTPRRGPRRVAMRPNERLAPPIGIEIALT